jgi:transcriptional regulator with XRE-family HTH domain
MTLNPRIPRRAGLSSQPDFENQFLPRLGVTVAKYRKQAAFTQKELAEHLQVTVTHVSALENGRRGVSLHVLYRIAGILSVNIATLVNEANGTTQSTN